MNLLTHLTCLLSAKSSKTKVFLFLLPLLVTIDSLLAGTTVLAAVTKPSTPSSSGFFIEWEGPAYELTTSFNSTGETFSRMQVGDPYYKDPHWPHLPIRSHLIALPPRGSFGVKIIDVDYVKIPLTYPLEPAPAVPLNTRDSSRIPPNDPPRIVADATNSDTGTVPSDFVTLSPAVWMRNQRLTRLTFKPFYYQADGRSLQAIRQVRLHVWWDPPVPIDPVNTPQDTFDELSWHPPALDCPGRQCQGSAGTSGPPGQMSVLSQIVLNPSDLETFGTARQPINPPRMRQPSVASPAYKVQVTSEGLYALDHSTLVANGLPVENINPSTLQLLHDEREVALQWEGDNDPLFEEQERLLFYARPQLTRYTGYDVYWLSWGGDEGLRMATRSGVPDQLPDGTPWATVLAEENQAYDTLYAGRDGDRWFWHRLKLPDQVTETFKIHLDTPLPEATGSLRIWLQGFTETAPNPDHHVQIALNGRNVADIKWEGATPYTATINLPAGLLQAKDNEIEPSLPGDTGSIVEGTYIDAFAITYGLQSVSDNRARFRGENSPHAYTIGGFSSTDLRVYAVSDPAHPQIVTDFELANGSVRIGDGGGGDMTPTEYLVLSDNQIRVPSRIIPAKSLSDPDAGADYVIISHPDLLSALAPLAAHRQSQGMRVVTIDAESVYDRFGDGRMHPQAIKSFLKHAYARWPGPPPLYVLLVGDGTTDPRGYRADSKPTYLPPYLADVDPWLGEVPSDNHYIDLGDDLLPDMRVGRIPVNSTEEATAVVNKIILYETDPLPGDWNARLIFGADNPSSAGNHPADADREFSIYATPDYGYQGARVYLSQTSGEPHLYTDAQAAQSALITNLNQGALLYSYFGHASWHQEAVLETDDYAPLFHRDHVAQLSNHRRWPVVLHMTCLTGYYAHPTSNTLDESLLRAEGTGAVAVWGASGNGISTGHNILHQSFYQSVFDQHETELGLITHQALTTLYTRGIHHDLIETFHLMGDPALNLQITIRDWPFSSYLPAIYLRHSSDFSLQK